MKKNVQLTLRLKVAETLEQVLLVVSVHWLHCMRPGTSKQQPTICQDRCCVLLLFLQRPGELPWRPWLTMRPSSDDISLCLLQYAWKWPIFRNLYFAIHMTLTVAHRDTFCKLKFLWNFQSYKLGATASQKNKHRTFHQLYGINLILLSLLDKIMYCQSSKNTM